MTDRAKLLHLEDVRTQIARALDPLVQATDRRSTTEFSAQPEVDSARAPGICWPGCDVTLSDRR